MINLITFPPLLSHGEHPWLLGGNAMFLRKTFRREWDRSFQGNEQLGGRPRFHLCWREIRTKKSSDGWLITLRFRFSPVASHQICCWGNENCQTGLIYACGHWVSGSQSGEQEDCFCLDYTRDSRLRLRPGGQLRGRAWRSLCPLLCLESILNIGARSGQ